MNIYFEVSVPKEPLKHSQERRAIYISGLQSLYFGHDWYGVDDREVQSWNYVSLRDKALALSACPILSKASGELLVASCGDVRGKAMVW